MISPCPPYYSSALSCLLLSDIEKLGCGCHTRAPKPISVSCVCRGAEARTALLISKWILDSEETRVWFGSQSTYHARGSSAFITKTNLNISRFKTKRNVINTNSNAPDVATGGQAELLRKYFCGGSFKDNRRIFLLRQKREICWKSWCIFFGLQSWKKTRHIFMMVLFFFFCPG